jgi:hypothetical protein
MIRAIVDGEITMIVIRLEGSGHAICLIVNV